MKKRLTGYTFNAASKTVTHADFSDVGLAGIQLITNVTDGIIIYQFNEPSKGGTLSTDTLTLDYDTSAMDNADELMVLVDDAVTTQPVSGTVTVSQSTATNLKTQAEAYQGGLAVAAGNPLQVTLANGSVPSHAVTNAGTFATQENGAALTSLQLIDDTVATTGSAITTKGLAISGTDGTNARVLKTDSSGELQVDVLTLPNVTVGSALPAGTNAIGKLAANSGVDIGDVDVTSIAAGTNAIGNVGIIPRTSGGLTTYHLVSAATTNATVVKASAGQLFGWYIYNSNASARKLVFHNSASSPTAGASVYFSLVIPPSSGANVFSDVGMAFSSGIAITTVTGLADSDSTAVAANDLVINLWYS